MNILIAAVGRMKPGPERTIMDAYLARLPWTVEIKEIDQKKTRPKVSVSSQDTDKLLTSIPSNAKTVCLDSRGNKLTSEMFAKKIADWRDDGVPQIAFIIGGPDGLSDEVVKKADLTLSFGAVTWTEGPSS